MAPMVYLAGQWNAYHEHWKDEIKKTPGFDFFDPEIDADQSSPDTFFPQDLLAVKRADIMLANPGVAPSEGTWIEIGYFLAFHTKAPGDKCLKLIIIWHETRQPRWSVDFVMKAGVIVGTVGMAQKYLATLKGRFD
ncbi:nucleoside 2-deoxyribosyltransferase [Patescibacteria group bacterium]|nr:nucleoside 2-deoxyribosyltransferase [Patescibacteria group bacterium]